ncbi:deoxyuridine 5'-triphosphate nucleotidohydrolase [Brevibacillus laterosporus]|uniref:dUTP diphosphatase n=1 Tax=Brevibacillus laterosporus TaxID=1465 RepID=A0A518V9E5_BRELA|nr:deoxyuridine 5'-triphosphate nucleotidohydrolase [Brevibacillus laterosporus]
MVPVKIKRLHPDAVIPQYATAGSAGFDLVAVEDVAISPGETKKVPLGLAFEMPAGYVMMVCMRSGIAYNTKLRQPNGIGIIDSDYRGEVAMVFENTCGESEFHDFTYGLVNGNYLVSSDGDEMEVDGNYYDPGVDVYYLIRKGDRVAQGLILPVMLAQFIVVDELSETERGAGGFGSTGVSA